jgi:cation diffusion facilitator CzcD-associated flavoprotein CzcO
VDDLQPGKSVDRFDVIVIGAGVTGLAALHLLREKGLTVRLFEEGSGVGGVWYWNRYPGCRFDTYSPTYAYSFSSELLQEWDWTETYAAQPESERYLNLAADRLDLRRDITFNARVTSATFDETGHDWLVELQDGSQARCQFLVTAVGRFSSRYVPQYPGLESFAGTWVHTGRWPSEGVDLEGKRVAVIGTGATGVQVIPQVAKVASQLTVFQRTANYCVPIDNEPITPQAMRDIKANYDEIFRLCEESPVLELDRPDPRSGLDVPQEERFALYEEMWKNPGVAPKFIPLFYDVMVPGPINQEYSEFVKGKIRERVADPVVAEKLVPRDHTFAAKRPPGETGYYEVFNQGNVELVDLKDNPIERITPTGVKTRDGEYPVDVIIFATGWDVLTGALLSIDINGEGGLTLREKFAEGLRSYLFIQTAGFPNLFLINASVSGSFVRSVEPLVSWLAETMCYVREHGYRSIAPRPEAEDAWTAYAIEAASKLLMGQASSALIGANIPGKPRVPLLPPESEHSMRARRRDEAANGYPGFELR